MSTESHGIAERTKELEQTARTLEADDRQRNEWHGAVNAFAEAFLTGLTDAPAFRTDEGPGDPVAELGIPETATPLPDLLETIQGQLLDVHLNPASPRFFGYIPSGFSVSSISALSVSGSRPTTRAAYS